MSLVWEDVAKTHVYVALSPSEDAIAITFQEFSVPYPQPDATPTFTSVEYLPVSLGESA